MIATIKVNHIVATDLDGCIGKDNKLMWYIPADLKRFKSLTEGGVVVMGRKTFESLGCKPLPNRFNIVISSDYYYALNCLGKGVVSYNSIDAAIARAKYEASVLGVKEVWIIGGQSIYEQTIQYVDKIVKTVVYNRFNGDTSYQIPVDKFEESSRSPVYADKESEISYQFITYRLIKEKSVIEIKENSIWELKNALEDNHTVLVLTCEGYRVSYKYLAPENHSGPDIYHTSIMNFLNEFDYIRMEGVATPIIEEGRKDDSNKPRYSLLPTGTVNQVVQVMEYGAVKYDPGNWKLVENARTRYYDAAMRHIDDWWNGSTTDSESGLPHLAHAICCLLFLMWFDDQE